MLMQTVSFFLVFLAGSLFSAFGFYFYFSRQYRILTQAICDDLDSIVSGIYLNAYDAEIKTPGTVGRRERDGRFASSADLETQSSKIRAKLEAISCLAQYSKKESALRLKEIQQMISDISHQLKTPLSNILLYSDSLKESGELGDDGQRFLLVMQSQIHKLEFLVQSLIKMSRLESHMLLLRQENALLFPALSKAVSAVLPAASQKELLINVHCPEQLRLHFDPKWTEEAIFNVLDNAVKYTTSKGSIRIKVEPWQFYTRIQIFDTGIGIEPKHQSDIFKRFYRERRVHNEEGIGIGLYLTREILERQGGYITVASAPGKGSCFSLFLPNVQNA
ncbi:MAG: HAMP domain-containing histidine kinase [Eubacterium sp.]|nr:HAMP domain-containing histidine kinase [Eubacterium sp.]